MIRACRAICLNPRSQPVSPRWAWTYSFLARCRQRIGRINALFTQVQQLWTAVDSFDTPAMQPNPADGEPATLKIYPPLSHLRILLSVDLKSVLQYRDQH